jgi:MFS family permease
MITSAWYKRQEGAPRFGIWFCGLGVGQIIGGLVSFAAQHSTSRLQSWRVMFLVIGVVNILISGFIFRLPPDPEKSTFLTPAEIEFIVQRLKDDHAGVGPKVVRKRSVIEAILDLQTWLLCLITLLTTMSAGVVVYYSALLITTFGYNSKQAALLNMPSGLVAIISTLCVVTVVRNGYPRWLTIAIACIPPTIGGCLMSFLPATSKIGLLVGVYLVNTVSSYSNIIVAVRRLLITSTGTICLRPRPLNCRSQLQRVHAQGKSQTTNLSL